MRSIGASASTTPTASSESVHEVDDVADGGEPGPVGVEVAEREAAQPGVLQAGDVVFDVRVGFVDGEIVHIFARAPIGDTAGEGLTQGGTVENIRRLLGADDVQATGELATLISDDVFVVGSSSELLADLGLPGEAPIPVSPTVRYLDACTPE